MSMYNTTGHTKVNENPNPHFYEGQTIHCENVYGENEIYAFRIVTRYKTEVIDREANYYNENMQYLVERSGKLYLVFSHQIISYQ